MRWPRQLRKEYNRGITGRQGRGVRLELIGLLGASQGLFIWTGVQVPQPRTPATRRTSNQTSSSWSCQGKAWFHQSLVPKMTNSAEFVRKKFSKHSLNWLWCDVISDPRTRSRSKCRETICTTALPRWAVPWRAQPSIASNFELEFWHIFRSFGQFTNDLTDKAWWTGTLLSWIYLRRQSYPWGQIINFANIQTPQHQNQSVFPDSEVSCIARYWVQPSAWQGSGIDYLLSNSITSSDSPLTSSGQLPS